MSKERARRREERARDAATLAAARTAEAERLVRRASRRAALTAWVPSPRPGQSGALAARRRRDAGLVLMLVLALNLLVWLASDGWALRALVLLISLLATPVVLTLMSRK